MITKEELEAIRKRCKATDIPRLLDELIAAKKCISDISGAWLFATECQLRQAERDKKLADMSPDEESLDLVEIALRRKERAEKAERFIESAISEPQKIEELSACSPQIGVINTIRLTIGPKRQRK